VNRDAKTAMAAASNAIMSHASAEHAGMAASIEEVAIELGGAIGITVPGSSGAKAMDRAVQPATCPSVQGDSLFDLSL
jgi:MFS transporter, DHA2 family, multidrug resistance protein